ncbi:MAG: hypothetical protein ACWA5R_08090 [bacterium]
MKMNRVLLTLILILSFQAPAYSADANNSFTGIWTLDLNASDSLDGRMKAQGRSAWNAVLRVGWL